MIIKGLEVSDYLGRFRLPQPNATFKPKTFLLTDLEVGSPRSMNGGFLEGLSSWFADSHLLTVLSHGLFWVLTSRGESSDTSSSSKDANPSD